MLEHTVFKCCNLLLTIMKLGVRAVPTHTHTLSLHGRAVTIAPQPFSAQVRFDMDRKRTPARLSWPHTDISIS